MLAVHARRRSIVANNPVVTCDENHTYRAEGVIVPGVTEILGIFADYARVPRHILEAKRILGRAVHRCIELYEAEQLDPDSVDDAVMPYLEGWIRFSSDRPLRIMAAERIVYSTKYRYAGRLDLVIAFVNKPDVWCLLDVKTVYDMVPETALQTAGYAQAYQETFNQAVQQRAGLQLKPDGSYCYYPYQDRTDLNIFLNALAIRAWINNHRR